MTATFWIPEETVIYCTCDWKQRRHGFAQSFIRWFLLSLSAFCTKISPTVLTRCVLLVTLRPATACQTCRSLCGTHSNSSKPFRRSSKRPHSFSQSPLTGCYYHYSFQWTYAGPSFKVSDGCYTNRPQNSNPTLAFFPPPEHHLQRRLLWQGRLGRQPPRL